MTSCCQPHPMLWNGAIDAIARCKRVSIACGRKHRSEHVLHWICGVKRKPKAGNKPLHYCIVHELDKPGSSATVSIYKSFWHNRLQCQSYQRWASGAADSWSDAGAGAGGSQVQCVVRRRFLHDPRMPLLLLTESRIDT